MVSRMIIILHFLHTNLFLIYDIRYCYHNNRYSYLMFIMFNCKTLQCKFDLYTVELVVFTRQKIQFVTPNTSINRISNDKRLIVQQLLIMSTTFLYWQIFFIKLSIDSFYVVDSPLIVDFF